MILAVRSFRAALATLPEAVAYTKRRVRQHIMEDRSIRIVRDVLPDHWVIREYRPDYGIDLLVELFEPVSATEFSTLGELLFVQVKSTEVVKPGSLRVHSRRNVELGPLQERSDQTEDIEVVRVTLDTNELLTVQAMGAAIPVLLFLVELSKRRIYFVSLNDLIEKVILPHDPDYADKATKVIHIPARNCAVELNALSLQPLELYAKRAKMYAAFEKFTYQRHELEYALLALSDAPPENVQRDTARGILDLVRHFISIALRYDFWTRTPQWDWIQASHVELVGLREFLLQPDIEADRAALHAYLLNNPAMWWDETWVRALDLQQTRREVLHHIGFIWQRLANLAGMYEEVVREWYLPTYLSTTLETV